MAIPFAEQFYVERDRNFKYLFLSVMVTVLLPVFHGLIFLWLPWALRGRRKAESLTYKPFFTFLKYYEALTRTFSISICGKLFYFQPSLLLVAIFHVGINWLFAVAETKDITYESWYYIVSKRVGRLSIAHVPIILILVAKNNLVAAASGLTLDKAVFFHKWYGRSMFITTIIHMVLSLKYWLGMDFQIMVKIPPQIFGFIAFSCLGMLNIASLKFVRNMAFEFFLAQHRIFNFIMLLLAYFHNGGNHAAVILGVHLLVLDRIVARVLGLLHKFRGPTKGLCDFEILDETTVRVSIPISVKKYSPKWYWFFVPRYKTWRAGQHVLFNCNKVQLLAYHPFTIASLPDSGKMILVIKVQTGFTRLLHKRLCKMACEEDEEAAGPGSDSVVELSHYSSESLHSSDKLTDAKHEQDVEIFTKDVEDFQSMISGFKSPRVFNLKAGINGPFGANYQPLTRFDSVVFFSAGSGASFTLPVALDLLTTLQKRDQAEDYLYRPHNAQITIVLAMKQKSNLQWYDHLWKDFVPFFNAGKAQLALHITQEVPDAVEDEGSETKEKFDDVHEVSTSVQEANSSSQSSLNNRSKGVSVTYGRPDLEAIITSSVHDLCSPTYRKAFASVSCGPGAFNHKISEACEKGRLLSKAPDVYCYEESFE
ncbi:hypothetical protein OXX79_007209 [Metschnikowia pulcherrima]